MTRVNDALAELSPQDIERIRDASQAPSVVRAFAGGAVAGAFLGLPTGPAAPLVSAAGALTVGTASALYALGADEPSDERAAMAFLGAIGPGLGVSEQDAEALRRGDIASDRFEEIVSGLGAAQRQQLQQTFESITGRQFQLGESVDPHFRARLSVEQLMSRAGRGMDQFREGLEGVDGTQDLLDQAQSLLGMRGVDKDLTEQIYQFASARQEGDETRTQQLRRSLIVDLGGESVTQLETQLGDEDSALSHAFGEVYQSRAAASTRMSFLRLDQLTGEQGLGDRLFRQALTDGDEQDLVQFLGGGDGAQDLVGRVAKGQATSGQLEELVSKLAHRTGHGEDTEVVSFQGGLSERTAASLAVTERSLRSLASMIEALDRRVSRMER